MAALLQQVHGIIGTFQADHGALNMTGFWEEF